jgi:hypothetical protein
MSRLRIVIKEFEVEKACEILQSYFRDINERREDPKDLLIFFPQLVNRIFVDTNETLCWMKVTKPSQIEALKSLLSPKGSLFRALLSYSADNTLRFEFPLSNLPAITRSLILSSKTALLPSLYTRKLEDTSSKVMLNIYEYYFFHFAWFATVVERQSSGDDKISPSFRQVLNEWTDSLLKAAHFEKKRLGLETYLTLLEQYLNFFFPRPYTKTEVDIPSKTLVQICVEFWLNQSGDLNTDYVAPTMTQMTCTLTLLRHILDSVLIFDPQNFQTEFHEQYVKQSRVLHKLVQDVISKPLYIFLKQSFFYSYWKFDSQLLAKMIEIWLLYINPWKEYSKTSSSDKLQQRRLTPEALNYRMALFAEHVKKPYILHNFLFYVPILIRFLTMALDFDFCNVSPSNVSEIRLLHNVLLVFANADILKIITEIEDVLNTGPPVTYRSNFDQMTPLQTQCFAVLEDNPNYHYISLLHRRNVEIAEQLIGLLKVAEMNKKQLSPQKDNRIPLTTLLKSDKVHQLQHIKSPQHLDQDSTPSINELIELLCLIFKIPDKGVHIPIPLRPVDAKQTTSRDEFEDMFKPQMKDHKLSDIGKLQILKGQKLCTNKDVQFRGDERLRPITSMENAFLVRLLYAVSKFLERKTGYYVNLRPLGHYRTLTWLCISFLLVYSIAYLLTKSFSFI